MRCCLGILVVLLTGSFIVVQADTTWVTAGPVEGLWDATNSPYMIQGDIEVRAGDSLRIGPGVRVIFRGRYGLTAQILSYFTALGAPGDSVVFTTDTLQNPQRWSGLALQGPRDTCRLDYCVIEHGIGPNTPGITGGVLRASGNTSLALTHSALRFNRGRTDGSSNGGAASIGGWLRMEDCIVEENRAGTGGGLAVGGGGGEVTRCVFRRNAASDGGGVKCSGSGPRFQDCVIEHNTATARGGGLFLNLTAIRLDNCAIRNNHSDGAGGGFYTLSDEPRLRGCAIEGNTADSLGGGGCCLFAVVEYQNLLEYCVLRGNAAAAGGALALGEMLYSGYRNCTFVENSALAGAAVHSASSITMAQFTNCIFANSVGGAAFAFPPYYGHSLTYNVFWGNTGGDYSDNPVDDRGVVAWVNENGDSCDYYANMYLDPQFVDPLIWDYRIQATSPCVDAGAQGAGVDPDGSRTDIGVFPYDHRINPPGPFHLSGPPHNEVIYQTGPVRFTWQASRDPDRNDPVDYELHLAHPDSHLVLPGGTVAGNIVYYDFDVSALGLRNLEWVPWWVVAHSNYPPRWTASLDTFRFWLEIYGSAEPELPALPRETALHAAYPNPFNATTVIPYDVARAGRISLRVFDLLGREVAVLTNEMKHAGSYQAVWQAQGAASGVYFVVLEAGCARFTQKLLLLR